MLKVDFSEMREMHKTAAFHSNLLISKELVTKAIKVDQWNARISKDHNQAGLFSL